VTPYGERLLKLFDWITRTHPWGFVLSDKEKQALKEIREILKLATKK